MATPTLTRRQSSMEVLDNGDIIDTTHLPSSARNNLYKTELCKHFMDNGHCRYGNKCQFAHGETELRGVLRHPKYKTTPCKVFAATGKCSYGHRCRFIHEAKKDNQASKEIVLAKTTTPLVPLTPLTQSPSVSLSLRLKATSLRHRRLR